VITGVTEIAHITTKQDMSRWTRAHADAPGINWSVFAGPGGTMIIVEHAEDRCSFGRPQAAPDIAGPADSAMTRRADGAARADSAVRADRADTAARADTASMAGLRLKTA
jgi:hypothetical protein